MRNIPFKRAASSVLAAAMLVTSLTALSSCKKEVEPVKERRTNVYAGTEISLPEGVEYINNMVCSGDNVYMVYSKSYSITRNELGEEVSRTPGYEYGEFEDDGWYIEYLSESYVATVPVSDGGNNITECAIKFDDGSTYVNNVAVGSDGTLWALKNTWEYNEDYTESQTIYSLMQIDTTTGGIGTTISLNDAITAAGIDSNNVYINYFALAENNTIYFSVDSVIVAIDSTGAFIEKIDLGSDGWLNSMKAVGDKLYMTYSTGNGSPILKVIENGQVTDIKTDNLSAILQNYYSIYGFDDSKMYYGTATGISEYDFTTDSANEILNYINSDIDSTNSNNIVMMPDKRVVLAQTDWSGEVTKTTMSIMTKVPDEQLSEEIILELGCVYTDYYLTKAIIKFNKQNTGVRVTVKEYSHYNNEENEYTGAVTQLNNDIETRNLPDIILLNSELPVESYFQKGIFADLNQFIDDEEIGINRSEYLDNIFRACEVDGKLNSMILSFSLASLAAKSRFVGTEPGWTLEEMMNVIDNLPEETSAFMEYSRQEILNNFFGYTMDTFINWDTGETHFEDEGFIKFIKFLATCSEQSYWDQLYPNDGSEYVYDEEKEKELSMNYDMRFYNDLSLFNMAYISNFSSILNLRRQFATSDFTIIGYPTTDENSNGASIVPQTELAISASSLAQKEAWSFITFVMNDEDYNARTWAFSTNIQRLEDAKAAAKDNYYYYEQSEEDLEWYRDYYSDEYYEYIKNTNIPFDEASTELVMNIVKGATTVQRSDNSLLEIINEELSGFFAGTKSAEETARVISSRARIYVSENS